MEGLMTGYGIVSILLLVAGILAVFIPFFILKIRNQVISINEKMDKIIKLLGGESEEWVEVFSSEAIPSKAAPDGMKYCGHCGALNGRWDKSCVKCGEPV